MIYMKDKKLWEFTAFWPIALGTVDKPRSIREISKEFGIKSNVLYTSGIGGPLWKEMVKEGFLKIGEKKKIRGATETKLQFNINKLLPIIEEISKNFNEKEIRKGYDKLYTKEQIETLIMLLKNAHEASYRHWKEIIEIIDDDDKLKEAFFGIPRLVIVYPKNKFNLINILVSIRSTIYCFNALKNTNFQLFDLIDKNQEAKENIKIISLYTPGINVLEYLAKVSPALSKLKPKTVAKLSEISTVITQENIA